MPDQTQNDGQTQTTQTADTQMSATQSDQSAITSIDQIPQHLRNQLEANHKRGLQSELQAARQQIESLNALKSQTGQLYEMLGDKIQIEEGSDLGDVASQIGGTLESLKTEKEKMEAANAKQGQLLEAAQKEAAQNLQNYHNTLITNDLYSQLGNDRTVSAKATELIAKELSQLAEVGDGGEVGFKMPVTDENGHTAEQVISAKEAVTLLESQKEWAAFFKATVNSGAGGEVVDGVKRAADGSLDLSALAADPAKYFEIHDKNPSLVHSQLEKMT